MSSDFLTRMADASRHRLEASIARCDQACMLRLAEQREKGPRLQLSAQGFDLIAEVKKKSPSAGELEQANRSPVEQAQLYAVAGAAAISVLTEPEEFSGDIADLEQVGEAVPSRPVMRKDFLVSPYQILEARAAGAGGVLLIASMLYAPELRDMLQLTHELGMFALVEIFDCEDLDNCWPVLDDMSTIMNQIGSEQEFGLLVGANCRSLRTLQVDFSRFKKMAGRLPDFLPCVAESGVDTPERAAQVAGLGYRLALVGTALMRAADPSVSTSQMLAEGRRVATR